jgi:threonine/homoserine/homoserine lactone efflux protein
VVKASAAISIALIALSLVVTPGPNMIHLISRSISQGRCAGLISLLGVGIAFFMYLVALIAGIARYVTVIPSIYLGLKFVGAAYLLWLAWNAARPSGRSAFTQEYVPAEPPLKLLLTGLMTNALNPKTAIVYITILPQLLDSPNGNISLQILVLGLIQIFIALSGNAMIIATAGSLAGLLARHPAWLRAQRYIMALALTGLAIRIAIS